MRWWNRWSAPGAVIRWRKSAPATGRWTARAAWAVRRYNNLPFYLIAVEPEPTYFHWLRQRLRDNDIDPSQHRLVWAAVTDRCGTIPLYVERPAQVRDGEPWFGQAIAHSPYCEADTTAREYWGLPLRRHVDGYSSIQVPCLTLEQVLDGRSVVDLLDMDIQGEELRAVASSADLLDATVKRLHIGTHSRQIERGLRKLLAKRGWQLLADYGCLGVRDTPYGPIRFEDGVQTWLNPRLASAAEGS
ncbi:MAG: FkbM family methyltransferase [Bryobacterales bacterium]|nr:FkbM family methyltransferase [Bryobacterales bacterium]